MRIGIDVGGTNTDAVLMDGRRVAARAIPFSIEIVEVEEVPLTYVPSHATRVHVKAVGDLAA